MRKVFSLGALVLFLFLAPSPVGAQPVECVDSVVEGKRVYMIKVDVTNPACRSFRF
ncbi:hypothetical protein [Ammonifex thiophilus]|uniref:hypothetical protein n=1 Tax=Ammonifex thiophilus TaxID=444093 RepID=UPI001401E5B7|nr:hypothetical protein [Ammonifex thiophilus]